MAEEPTRSDDKLRHGLSLVIFWFITAAAGVVIWAAGEVFRLQGEEFALLAALLLLPGLVAWGSGYLRAGRPRLGAALAGGPVVALLVVAVNVAGGVEFGPVGSLPVVLPFALAVGVVGYDLWKRAGNDAV